MTQLILAFDTTGAQDSMALYHGGEIISRLLRPDATSPNISSPKGSSQWQSSMLVPALKAFLAEYGASFQDVGTLCTLTGPGSFTGIRIGLATAQGLLIANPCHIFAPTVLDLLLFRGREDVISGHLIAVVDSKRGDYFALKSGADEAEIVTKDDLVIFIAQGGTVVSSEPIEGIDVLCSQDSLAAMLIAFYRRFGIALQSQFNVLEPFYLRNPEFAKKKSCLSPQ